MARPVKSPEPKGAKRDVFNGRENFGLREYAH